MSTNRNYVRRRELIPELNLPDHLTKKIFGYVDELAYTEYKFNIQFDDKDNELSITQRKFILFLIRHYDDFDINNFLTTERSETIINEDRLINYLGTKYDYVYISRNNAEYQFEIGRTNKVLIVEESKKNLNNVEEEYYTKINEYFSVGIDPKLRIHIDLCYFDKSIETGIAEKNKYINSIHVYAPYVRTLKGMISFEFSRVVLHLPSLTYIQNYTLVNGHAESFVLKAPVLNEIFDGFLYDYSKLKSLEIYAPELTQIGESWMTVFKEPNLEYLKMETPKLKNIGADHYDFTNFKKDNYVSESLPWENFKALL